MSGRRRCWFKYDISIKFSYWPRTLRSLKGHEAAILPHLEPAGVEVVGDAEECEGRVAVDPAHELPLAQLLERVHLVAVGQEQQLREAVGALLGGNSIDFFRPEQAENAPIVRAAIHCFNWSNLVGQSGDCSNFPPMVRSYQDDNVIILIRYDDVVISLNVMSLNSSYQIIQKGNTIQLT